MAQLYPEANIVSTGMCVFMRCIPGGGGTTITEEPAHGCIKRRHIGSIGEIHFIIILGIKLPGIIRLKIACRINYYRFANLTYAIDHNTCGASFLYPEADRICTGLGIGMVGTYQVGSCSVSKGPADRIRIVQRCGSIGEPNLLCIDRINPPGEISLQVAWFCNGDCFTEITDAGRCSYGVVFLYNQTYSICTCMGIDMNGIDCIRGATVAKCPGSRII